MIPWIKTLLWDETAFIRYGRAILLAAASSWQTYQIEGELTTNALIGALVMGFAGLLGAGEKNTK